MGGAQDLAVLRSPQMVPMLPVDRPYFEEQECKTRGESYYHLLKRENVSYKHDRARLDQLGSLLWVLWGKSAFLASSKVMVQ